MLRSAPLGDHAAMRALIAIVLALAPACTLLPPAQSAGDLTSPIVQASWESVTPVPPEDTAEALDESLSACTGPLAFGVQAADPVSVAQWCDCYRERHETDRHAYRQVCVPAVSPARTSSSTTVAEPRASPLDCPAPPWPDLRGDLDHALEELRRSQAAVESERAETGALRARAEALRRIGVGCRLVVGKDGYHQRGTTTWACDGDAVVALEAAVEP